MKAFLIDGMSFCYRAYYAIKELSTLSGRPTNAIYGFVVMLKKIIKQENPDYLIIAFDLKAPTFRHKKFKDYKIQRPHMPEDLKEQIPAIKEIIKTYGIPIFEMPGYEAEDVIATITECLRKKDIEVYIVTGDKDILQLVTDEVKVYNTHKEGLIYDKEKVKEKFGVYPEKVADVMALTGDKIDNIPGVSGIGLKTAKNLINKFGSLEEVLDNIDKIKNKRVNLLLKSQIENAKLAKELVLIDRNVPLKCNLNSLKKKDPDNKKLFKIFKELEFTKLLKDYAPSDQLKKEYNLISKEKDFERLLDDLKKTDIFAFDFETTGTNPHEAEPMGISFSFKEGVSFYLPLLEDEEAGNKKGILKNKAFKELRPIFEDEKKKKVAQNIKYEMIILSRQNIDLKNIYFDTMIASYLLNPSKLNHNLEDISLTYLGHKMIPISDLIGKGKKAISLRDVDLDKIVSYACEDSDVTFRLYKILEEKLKAKDLISLYKEIEMPLVEVLVHMELSGVSINVKNLKKMSKELLRDIENLREDIFKTAGEDFNINSPKQLQDILFKKFKLPILKRNKTGPSTDMGVLKELSLRHKLPSLILKYRELSKLKTTYVDALPKLVNPKTDRIHTSFNQTVTQTGRLSSSEPNLQNIPIKGAMSRKIREAFIPESDSFLFLSADYSQIELRVLAHLSGDERLKKAFKENIDIHSYTASLVFSVDLKEVTSEMRDIAKTVNFSIIYGVSPYGLSKELNIEIDKAKKFIDSYFDRYSKAKEYMDHKVEEAKEKGYVVTLFGRRRDIPQIKSQNQAQVNFARRIAINTPIQGTSSDLIKIAMINIYGKLKKDNLSSRMILQIHDELIFEVKKNELEKLKKLVKEEMEGVVKLSVPIKVDIKTGKNWSEC